MNLRLKFNTCITCISKHILDGTERISPNAKPPWRISELEILDRVKIFTLPTTPGVSVKEQWRDDHINFVTELEDNNDFLFIYSDRSLMEQGGRRRTGYSLVGYNKGEIVFKRSSTLGEHAEVYDMEMMGIQITMEETWNYINTESSLPKPHNVIFYADNTGTIDIIFDGKPGKGQAHSRAFRKTISKILNNNEDTRVMISWCPSHSGITGNKEADDRVKSGVRLTPPDPNHKTQSYVAGLCKREMQEVWRHRWTNMPNHPCSGFTLANNLPPSLCTTNRFRTLDHKTFSHLIQCRTGHTHIGDYYWQFVPSKTQNCACGTAIQTRFHVLKECRRNSKHRHCNICTPQAESTLRNPEAGSAYRLSPQSPVSKEARIKLWGITTHIQAKGSKFP